MARAFLQSVADHIFEHYKDNIEKLCIVLPNKRGSLFLKNYLARAFQKTIWLPAIISAEDLITELSGLKTLEEIDLICHLYESYRVCYGDGAEPFDSFAKWGQLILQDFNEIDRYLADPEQLYENLKDIKEIENWSLGAEVLSVHQTNYLRFMKSLGAIYKHFSAFLISNGWAYQGLAYRQAVRHLENSTYADQFHKLVFCGFNALNAAELKIFKRLHTQKKADLLWDADEYYLNNDNQEAGLFLRENFNVFRQPDPLFIQQNFKEEKSINIISVPKQIGQAQVVKQTLEQLISNQVPLDRVAVVLANEKLLWPVLQQLPGGVQFVNITMEYPLRYTSTHSLIELLLQIQVSFSKQTRVYKTVYHKDLVSLFRQPLFQSFLQAKGADIKLTTLIQEIVTRNLTFISEKALVQLLGEHYAPVQPVLQPAPSVSRLCDYIISMLQALVSHFSQLHGNQIHLELEYLQIALKNFNRLSEILNRYPYFSDILAFRQLYLQVVGSATAPFIGEPLRGLQIMGVLETRTLDFDHVILVNVNEGVLPSGKTINSFIPNDLKRAFGLPLYLEKDAIYAYHFYRLLQRASDITITYDSETDAFGKGEKSRFVTQLQLELPEYNPNISITERVATYPDFPEETDNTIVIRKDEAVLRSVLQKASSSEGFGGLSPSALLTYKECSLKFYFRYAARLKETEEVEESAEANTFGSILHLSLETLYKEFKGRAIDPAELKSKLNEVDAVVNQSFISRFDNAMPGGKSLLQEEVIKVYVKKMLNNDIKFIERLQAQGQALSLQGLEQEYAAPLDVPVNGKPVRLYIKGTIDRLDAFGGRTRIIDYKSSVKDNDRFAFESFDALFYDKQYNKALQLMIYAWLLCRNGVPVDSLLPGVIPFKVFADEPKYLLGGDNKPLKFTEPFILEFEQALIQFIASVFDESIPFSQTDDELVHEFCPYNSICNLKG